MQINILSINYSQQVASFHTQGITTGFISSLGQEFVATVYEAVAEDKNSFGFVAVENDKVLGFVAFSINLSRLYKHVALKKGFRFAFVLAKRMLSLQVIKKVWDNLFYPSKMKKMDLPDAELLSIVVSEQAQGKGIAKQLMEKGFRECARRGINEVKVLVGADNKPANKLYLRCGFELVRQINNHGIMNNIYVAKTGLKKADEKNCKKNS